MAQSTQVNDTAKQAAVGGGLGVGLPVAGTLTIGVVSVVYHFLGSGKNEDHLEDCLLLHNQIMTVLVYCIVWYILNKIFY